MRYSYHQVKLNIFDEIINGKLRPCLKPKIKASELKKKLKELNTVRLKCSGENSIETEINNICFNEYGFRDREDTRIEKKSGETEITLIILPLIFYRIEEDLDIPVVCDQRYIQYLELMEDTYVRSKIIARSIIDSNLSDNRIAVFAKRNHHKARILYNEAREYLNIIQNNGAGSVELLVIYAVNIILVKLLIYYQKMFKSYLKIKFETEEKLMTYFHKAYKLTTVLKAFAEIENKSKKQNETEFLKRIIGKWNGQKNQYPTLFHDLRKDKTPEGIPYLEITDENVIEFLCLFVDKDDQPFKPAAIKTILRKDRPEKRPKGNRRIDTSPYTDK